MGLGLVVAIVGMCWSWGWSVGTGKGATFGLELPLAEAVVTVADRMEPPVGCGFLGQSVLVAVGDGSHERLPWGWGCGWIASGVRWH